MTKAYDITRRLPGHYIYSALYPVMVSMLLCCVAGCRNRPPRPSELITFWRKDKNPYGTYVAFNDLKYIFPNAEIKFGSESVAGVAAQDGNKKALIYIGPRADLDGTEINTLMRFLGEGNHVFISALRFGDSLLNTLNIQIRSDYERDKNDSMRVSVLPPGSDDALSYVYPGLIRDTYITSLDSQYATVLGKDRKGRPNIVRFRYKGGGALILHFAPMALTNYFLLHKKNMGYYDNAFSYIPEDVSEVLWHDGGYAGRDGLGGGRNKSFSALRFITGTPPLYWGLIILLLLLLMVYLFESKRRQRIVPVIEGLRNNSLDFVQTIGRLYYQRRDNQNLAGKMAVHFQDYIRNKYNLSVHLSDETFVDRLSWKTGVSKEFLNVLKGDLLRMQQSQAVADEELLALNKKLEEFYKQA